MNLNPFVAIILFNLFLILHTSDAKDQYVLPLNMGMKSSISYDIANMFNRPNVLQGGLAIFLSYCILGIVFFGVITAPFGYMFGIPSQKYVLGDLKTIYQQIQDEDAASESRIANITHQFDVGPGHSEASPRNFGEHPNDTFLRLSEMWSNLQDKLDFSQFNTLWTNLNFKPNKSLIRLLKNEAWKAFVDFSNRSYSPNFLSSMFYLMPKSDPEVMSEGCQLLALCYGHGSTKHLPSKFIRLYSVFSRKMKDLPQPYKNAILLGLKAESETNCPEKYSSNCSENAFTIVLKSFLNFLPNGRLSPGVPKRKQAMYM